jgi:hypothetical protein
MRPRNRVQRIAVVVGEDDRGPEFDAPGLVECGHHAHGVAPVRLALLAAAVEGLAALLAVHVDERHPFATTLCQLGSDEEHALPARLFVAAETLGLHRQLPGLPDKVGDPLARF